jgi:hypothetical protein
MAAARREIVVIDGRELKLYEPTSDRSDVFHLAAERGGDVKAEAGWYTKAGGPFQTLALACEAAGIRYPSVIAHRAIGHRITGDLETVVRVELGEQLDARPQAAEESERLREQNNRLGPLS